MKRAKTLNLLVLPALLLALFIEVGLTAAHAEPSSLGVALSSTIEGAFQEALFGAKAPEKEPKPFIDLEIAKLELVGTEPINSESRALDPERFQDKRVVLHFWSIYCRGCVGQVDEVEALREELARENTELLLIHLFEPQRDKLLDGLTRLGLQLPTMLAPKAIRDLFEIKLLPTTLVFDDSHQLLTRIEGDVDADGYRLELMQTIRETESEFGLMQAEIKKANGQ